MNNNEYKFKRKNSSSMGHFIYVIISLVLLSLYVLLGLLFIIQLKNSIIKIIYLVMGCIWTLTIIVHFIMGLWKKLTPYIIIKDKIVTIFQLPFTKPLKIKLNQIRRFSKKPFFLVLHLKNGEKKSIQSNLLSAEDLQTFKRTI